jgi:DNA-binding CsgD family transcriptional regulator
MLEGLRVREPSSNPRRNSIVKLLRGEVAADRGADVSAALAEQLLALIAEHCALKPTILVIDDLQWADQASVVLWGRLVRSVRQMPLLMVGTIRPVPQRDDLLTLRRSVGDAGRIHLTGLNAESVADLTTTLAGGPPDDRLRQLAEGAAGNPLYVTELVAALVRSANLTISDAGMAELARGAVPPSLSAAIADRLGFVSGPVHEVLRAAALLGVDFAVPDLAVLLGRSVADLVMEVDEARAAGVLTESDNGLAFRHPLIRKALYDEMSASVRAAWHHDAGRALAQAGAPAVRVARQLLWAVGGSGEPPGSMDDWMLGWLAQSADLLVGQAPRVAAELLRQAVASCQVGSAQHDFLIGRLADALYRVGDLAEAEREANRALEHVVGLDAVVDLHWTLAQCRMRLGQSAESLATLDHALATPGISPGHRSRLLALAARTHLYFGHVAQSGEVAATALAAASDASDTWAMGWALHVMTICTAVQGQVVESLPLFDRALTVTQADPALTDLRLLLQINKTINLGLLDRFDEALTAAGKARRLADQVGTTIRLAQAHGALAQLLFETGRWDDAMAEVRILQTDLKEPSAAVNDLGIAAVINFHRGNLSAARNHLAAAATHAERIGNRLVGALTLARSLDREYEGTLPEALGVLTAVFAENPEELDQIEELLPDAVRLATAIGDQPSATELAGHAFALASDSQIPHRQANALYCRGLLDRDAQRLLQAAERYRAAGRPLLRAKALEAAAGEFISSEDREQARAAFTNAVEVYTALGAAADVARLQAKFRAHGIRRGPRAKHRQAQSGWDSLTPTEMKIASLVEEGLSNPEIAAKLFLSPRTVGTHVSHILKKLNVHSRTDIAREAALRTFSSK